MELLDLLLSGTWEGPNKDALIIGNAFMDSALRLVSQPWSDDRWAAGRSEDNDKAVDVRNGSNHDDNGTVVTSNDCCSDERDASVVSVVCRCLQVMCCFPHTLAEARRAEVFMAALRDRRHVVRSHALRCLPLFVQPFDGHMVRKFIPLLM